MARRSGIKVKNLTQTIRAFNEVEDGLADELKEGLKQAAEPVRVLAESRAISQISNMRRTPAWAEQKIVVSQRTALVYMAPTKRQTRNPSRKRRNLAGLLAGRAMEPALEANEEKVASHVSDLLDRLGRRHGF